MSSILPQNPCKSTVLEINRLHRTEQYRAANSEKGLKIAQMLLTGKIYNGRWFLDRFGRDHPQRVDLTALQSAIDQMKNALDMIQNASSRDALMGIEGQAAKAYFSVLPDCILRNTVDFAFEGRSRRPPLDPVNAMLSFAYTLLGNELAGALESVGLDPAAGFLHALRPGRASLALDLLEELRAPFADRFVITQINLGTITGKDFDRKENGAYFLKEDARKAFLAAWQKRKQEMILHPFLQEKLPWGLVPYAQAMLLARYLRGDLDAYPPFLWK